MVVLQAADTPSAPEPPVRVGGQIREPRKLKNVPPIYPADAKLAGLEGKVVLECTIDVQGAVAGTRVVEGVPPLSDAAMKAVNQWRYTPVLLNGKAVPVIMTVTLTWKDSQPFLSGLLESLKSKNEFLRESAVTWLGRAPSSLRGKEREHVTRELQRLKEHDESERVRTAAAQALLLEGQQAVQPAGSSAESGVTYRFTVHRRFTDKRDSSASGRVWVLGEKARLETDLNARDVEARVPVSRVILEAGGRNQVVDAEHGTSFEIPPIARAPRVSTMSVEPPVVLVDVGSVDVTLQPSSEPPAGLDGKVACQWWSLKFSYDLSVRLKKADGLVPGRVEGTGDFCLADSLPLTKLPFDQGLGITSGIPKVDAAIAERTSSALGIPIRQTLTVTRQIEGRRKESASMALELSDFQRVEIPLDRFEVP